MHSVQTVSHSIEKEVIIEMAALSVSIVANVRGVDIPWDDLSPELKREISTKLHNDAMSMAGYEKAPQKRQLHKEQI